MGADNTLIRFCNESNPLIIYGAGKVGRAVGEFLRKHGMKISCFCVTQIDETQEVLGCSVKEIAEIQREYNNAGVVVAVSEKFVEDADCHMNPVPGVFHYPGGRNCAGNWVKNTKSTQIQRMKQNCLSKEQSRYRNL